MVQSQVITTSGIWASCSSAPLSRGNGRIRYRIQFLKPVIDGARKPARLGREVEAIPAFSRTPRRHPHEGSPRPARRGSRRRIRSRGSNPGRPDPVGPNEFERIPDGPGPRSTSSPPSRGRAVPYRGSTSPGALRSTKFVSGEPSQSRTIVRLGPTCKFRPAGALRIGPRLRHLQTGGGARLE